MSRSDMTTVQVSVTEHLDDHHGDSWKTDSIAVEVLVALVYNCLSHAVMMTTPADLEDFAIGFSLTEDVVQSRDEISHIHVHHAKEGITIRLQITEQRFEALKHRRRNMVGRTGCGLCGTETLNQAIRPIPEVLAPNITDKAVQVALNHIRAHQHINQLTGATHAAAWCNSEGNILFSREDVGRHNALDKLIGVLADKKSDTTSGFILVTSRASYEMVQKTCKAGVGCLVAISAPTSLAIEKAEQAGLLLIGYARSARHVIYNNPVKHTLKLSHAI